jgi:hypothetical protein
MPNVTAPDCPFTLATYVVLDGNNWPDATTSWMMVEVFTAIVPEAVIEAGESEMPWPAVMRNTVPEAEPAVAEIVTVPEPFVMVTFEPGVKNAGV